MLANEQVIDGKVGDLGLSLRKKTVSWFLNISKFSEELLGDLNQLESWPEKVKLMQKLIGMSEGAEKNSKYTNQNCRLIFLQLGRNNL